MQPYIPVSCQLHSELELMIMHEKTLQLKLNNSHETTENLVAKPYNILTKDKNEFLQLKNTIGELIDIRLDRIVSFKISD